MRDQAEQYLRGLVQAERKNMERMAEVVPDTDYQRLQHFLTHSPSPAFLIPLRDDGEGHCHAKGFSRRRRYWLYRQGAKSSSTFQVERVTSSNSVTGAPIR